MDDEERAFIHGTAWAAGFVLVFLLSLGILSGCGHRDYQPPGAGLWEMPGAL